MILSREVPYLERCLDSAVEENGIHGIVGRW